MLLLLKMYQMILFCHNITGGGEYRLMPNSVWSKMTKRDIDQATEEFVKLAANKCCVYEGEGGDNEREKNERFFRNYIATREWRNSVIESLQPEQCSDVQVNERHDCGRGGNLMFIYFYEAYLNRRGESLKTQKHKILIYIKVELIGNTYDDKRCLVISFHEAERAGMPRYSQLPD